MLVEIYRPTEAEFNEACKVVLAVVSDPHTGWDRNRAKFVSDLLDTWRAELRENLCQAAHDAEKD